MDNETTGLVWVTRNLDTEEIEIFGTRPVTPGVGGEWESWPERYQVFEGYINGGDSVMIEERDECGVVVLASDTGEYGLARIPVEALGERFNEAYREGEQAAHMVLDDAVATGLTTPLRQERIAAGYAADEDRDPAVRAWWAGFATVMHAQDPDHALPGTLVTS